MIDKIIDNIANIVDFLIWIIALIAFGAGALVCFAAGAVCIYAAFIDSVLLLFVSLPFIGVGLCIVSVWLTIFRG